MMDPASATTHYETRLHNDWTLLRSGDSEHSGSAGDSLRRALLNLLEDASAERAQLQAVQRATLNILADFSDEKSLLASTQRAITNILEDLDGEKTKLDETNLQLETEIEVRKKAQAAIATQAGELERSNKDLEQFAYVASHDLQEPLRMVASYTQLLAQRYRGKLDSDADDFIGYAVDGAKRMQGLIEDLLSYSRVGTRARALRCCGCERIVQKALQNLSVAIAESGAAVEVADLPDITCDELQLETVFQNLIGNAIKFRDKRRPCVIQVSARQEGPNWVFSVKDNGIGIEARHFERIFQVFQRLYTREEYPGSGIGLAISKKIIERHRGRIWLESQFGAGTTFFFTIPNATIAAIQEAANAASTR